MSLQIRKIGVYSKEGELRAVSFALGRLNIVTGASKTGKSALLDIVDYCWGRAECTVAEGEIRRATSWFAVLFDHSGEGVLVARRNPGPARRSSDEIFFMRGVEELPETSFSFEKNVTAAGLRTQLSTLLGIQENLFTGEGIAVAPTSSASSGQAILYCLQAQDEIANRRLLFHRQGDQFVPSLLKETIPYFLGAMDESYYLNQRRLADAQLRLKRLEREYSEIRAMTAGASETMRALFNDAKRAGLISQGISPDAESEFRDILASAAAPRPLSYAKTDDPSADLSDLEQERRRLRTQLQEMREEIGDIKRLSAEASEFQLEAREQQARLSSIGLMQPMSGTPDHCPLCASALQIPVPRVDDLRDSLASLAAQLSSVTKDGPRLQAHLAELETRRAQTEETLRRVQKDITARIQQNERLRIEQDQFTEQARIAGRISFFLENAEARSSDDGIKLSIARLRAEIAELSEALDQDALEDRITTALNIIGRELTKLSGLLELEHAQNDLRLDRKNLTVVADTAEGPLYLSQIGSGENWVGYHVAAHLAIHKLFRSRQRPIPSFLMLDQPSQTHYPPDRDVGQISSGQGEDEAAVTRLYKLMWSYCNDMDGRMQLIVCDHVELLEDWFRASMVERWRDGIKLIPESWLRPSQ